MLFGEMSNVCSENHMTCKNGLGGQNPQLLAGAKYQQSDFKECLCMSGGGEG